MRLSLVLVVFLAGCASSYGKYNGFTQMGYQDERVGENKYRITYRANAYTSSEDTLKFWHVRAAELCGGPTEYEAETNQGFHYEQRHNYPEVSGTAICLK